MISYRQPIKAISSSGADALSLRLQQRIKIKKLICSCEAKPEEDATGLWRALEAIGAVVVPVVVKQGATGRPTATFPSTCNYQILDLPEMLSQPHLRLLTGSVPATIPSRLKLLTSRPRMAVRHIQA